MELGGHPESFQLARESPRLYANVPALREVVVVDRAKAQVEARWKLEGLESNYPMAFDEARGRLFIGCRKPAGLVVLDVTDGRTVARCELGGDVDDLFLDRQGARLLAICGAGFVDALDVADLEQLRRAERVATRDGARAGLLFTERATLHVAAPARTDRGAAVLELAVRP